MDNKKEIIQELKNRLDETSDERTSWGRLDLQSQPIVAVDAIIEVKPNSYLLIKRKFPPFQDYWALPGGIVKYGESVEDALKREVKEEVSLNVDIVRLVGVYSKPNRDPRGHVISICYLCKVFSGTPKAKSDAMEVRLFTVSELKELRLAFDHLRMIKDAGILD
ncbi:MAG: NUDIX domain-containing protein [Candidatus Odinarchaeia archaeon]